MIDHSAPIFQPASNDYKHENQQERKHEKFKWPKKNTEDDSEHDAEWQDENR